jgi:CelD/BcsL family acetyltransferase involved in cellulose biosynthesis
MRVTEPTATKPRSTSTADARAQLSVGEHDSSESPSLELTTEIITTVAGIRALEPDYEHLYQVTGNTLPFALQEWHLAWCEHFLNRSPPLQDSPRFCVLRSPTGACVALVPLILTRRRLGPLRVATLAPIGADPALTEIRKALVAPGYERLSVRAVQESLSEVTDWDWIHWSGLSEPMAEALTRETAPRWYEVSEDYILDLPSSWEEFRAGLKRNIRESLRHCYNSLKRDGHRFELVVARDRQDVQRALHRFLELHALRANMAWGARHPNHFAGRAVQEFLYDVCGRLAARDAVRVFQLRIGTEIVASRIGFAIGDGVYLYYSGFDPAWARYSVMTTTLAEAIKYAIGHGFKTVNLSLTREQSKLRWNPRLVRLQSALVQREVLRSRIVCRAYRLAITRQGPSARILKSVFWPHRHWD